MYRVTYSTIDYSGVETIFETCDYPDAFRAQLSRDAFNDKGDDEFIARAYRPDGSEMSNAFDVV